MDGSADLVGRVRAVLGDERLDAPHGHLVRVREVLLLGRDRVEDVELDLLQHVRHVPADDVEQVALVVHLARLLFFCFISGVGGCGDWVRGRCRGRPRAGVCTECGRHSDILVSDLFLFIYIFYRIVSAAGGDLPGVVLQEDIVDDVSQHLRGEGVPLVDGPAGDEEGVVPPAGARSHVGTVPGTKEGC